MDKILYYIYIIFAVSSKYLQEQPIGSVHSP